MNAFMTPATGSDSQAASVGSIYKVTFRRRIAVLFATATLLGAGMTSLLVSSASAATVTQTATTYVAVTFQGGATHSYPCEEGTTYHTGFPAKVVILANNCGVRVWLHQNNNNSGVSLCFNPYTYYTVNSVTFENVYISNNRNNC